MPQRQPFPTGPLTVVQMADRLQLSRRRFYELIDAGKFPPPLYRVDNRKPFYSRELQEECMDIRSSGDAFDGTLLLFNRPRVQNAGSARARSPQMNVSRAAPRAQQEHADLIGYLADHGFDVTASKVAAALTVCFPGGTGGVDSGRVWRDVLRHFRSINRT